jgi:hypothetical protein
LEEVSHFRDGAQDVAMGRNIEKLEFVAVSYKLIETVLNTVDIQVGLNAY